MRHGILRIKHTDNSMKESTIFDIIKQLRALKEVKLIEGKPEGIEFTSSTKGKTYMDVIASKYNSARYDEDGKIILPNFLSVLRKLASETQGLQKLRSLGANDIDIALINGDVKAIQTAALNNEANDPYTLAKNWKFLPLTHGEKIDNNDLYKVMLSIQNQQILLTALPYQVFEYKKLNTATKTLLIDIQDLGDDNWDYHTTKEWHDALNKYFDQVVISGNGMQYLLPNHVLNDLNNYVKSKENVLERDFAFVTIHGHDSKEGKWEEVISQLPKLAQQTLYLLSACYSGQYHQSPPANVFLITTSSAEEISDTRDYDKIIGISSYLSKNKPNTYSIMRFIAENWEYSKPHFSGVIGEEVFEGRELKEVITMFSEKNLAFDVIEEAKEESSYLPIASLTILPEQELQLVNVMMFPMTTDHLSSAHILGDVSPVFSDIV